MYCILAENKWNTLWKLCWYVQYQHFSTCQVYFATFPYYVNRKHNSPGIMFPSNNTCLLCQIQATTIFYRPVTSHHYKRKWGLKWSTPAGWRNSAALMPNSANEPVTNRRLPLWLCNTRQDNTDHERYPQGNSTIKLLSNMETPVRHHSVETERTCVSIHKHSSVGDWKLQQRSKSPATENRAFTLQLQQTNPS